MVDWDKFWFYFKVGIPSNSLFYSLIIAVIVIIAGSICNGIKSKKRFIFGVILVEYVFVVVCSTIVSRGPLFCRFENIQLTPFWTYKAILTNIVGVSVWDIVLNVLLFVPLGFLVKLLFKRLSLWKMILIAVLCSVLIETNQYIFEKGVAQTDDVMHNTVGAIIGWAITWLNLGRCRQVM